MALGSVQQVIACQESLGAYSVAPCLDDASGNHYVPVVVRAYLLDVSSQNTIEAALEPVDPQLFGAWFAFVFVATLSLYFTALGIGYVLGLIRGRR
jgi:hypothetical protein